MGSKKPKTSETGITKEQADKAIRQYNNIRARVDKYQARNKTLLTQLAQVSDDNNATARQDILDINELVSQLITTQENQAASQNSLQAGFLASSQEQQNIAASYRQSDALSLLRRQTALQQQTFDTQRINLRRLM